MSEVFKADADVDAYYGHQENGDDSKSNEYYFTWNGGKVNSAATPESLGLTDRDAIDVLTIITISLRCDQTGHEILCKLKPTPRLRKVVNAFASRYRLFENDIELYFNGVCISNYDETPLMLGIKNNDKITF